MKTILSKDTLIEGQIVKKGTSVEVRSLEEASNEMDFQSFVDGLHNMDAHGSYTFSGVPISKSGSLFYAKGNAQFSMMNRNLVIDDLDKPDTSFWIDRKDVDRVKFFSEKNVYAIKISGGYIYLNMA